MYEALLILVAMAAGTAGAELPATGAPTPVYRPPEVERPQADAPVYRPGAERPQADAPAHRPEVEAPERREPFSVDFMGDAYAQERNKHQAGPATEVGGGGAGYAAGAHAQQEVTYPDVAYAPGYGYEPAYGAGGQQAFDRYGNAVGYYDQDMEPYAPPTTLGLLWSALPDARGVAGAVGRALSLVLSGAFLVALGAALTVAVCTFTGLCAVSYRGLAVTEQMRALVSDERLQQLGAAAGVLQRALAKYRAMQREPASRRR